MDAAHQILVRRRTGGVDAQRVALLAGAVEVAERRRLVDEQPCAQTGAVPEASGAVGLVNMQIVDAAYASARSGAVVALPTA